MSTAVWVGSIALMGVDAETGAHPGLERGAAGVSAVARKKSDESKRSLAPGFVPRPKA